MKKLINIFRKNKTDQSSDIYKRQTESQKIKQTHKSKTISDLAAEVTERRRMKEIERSAKDVHSEEEYQRAAMLKTAFVPYWFSKFRLITCLVLVMTLIFILYIKFENAGTVVEVLLIFSAIVVGVALALLITWIIKAWFIRRGHRWLHRFPYHWDSEAYMDILSQSYHRVQLILRITLDSRVPPDWQTTVADAVEALMKDTQLQWKDDKLIEVVSPDIHAYQYHHGAVDAYNDYTNRRLHVWFMRFVDRVFPVLHREFPINRIAFSIKSFSIQQIFPKQKDY